MEILYLDPVEGSSDCTLILTTVQLYCQLYTLKEYRVNQGVKIVSNHDDQCIELLIDLVLSYF